jgi:choline dehydrogenase-like flavoprotein
VVVLEQGPWRTARDFDHDEVGHWILGNLTGTPRWTTPRPFGPRARRPRSPPNPPPLIYARGVGGSSVHFTANYWRLRPVDFHERSRWGPISGTGFADWPLTYDELEPYYTRAEWEVGCLGHRAPGDPRGRILPHASSSGKVVGRALRAGGPGHGVESTAGAHGDLSEAYEGRPPCMHCGYCMGFGCEVNAKSSTLASMIPKAVATNRCEIRPDSTVIRVETNASGRAVGVVYLDADGVEHRQRGRAVVLAANGAETPATAPHVGVVGFPDGLANGSGLVGKYLMFNGQTASHGVFEHPLNEYKSVQVTRILMDFYDADPARGFYGGGGMDGRMFNGSPLLRPRRTPARHAPVGRGLPVRALPDYFVRTMEVAGHTTSLPWKRTACRWIRWRETAGAGRRSGPRTTTTPTTWP